MFGSFGAGYYKGGEAENEKQQIEIARLNTESKQKEQALVNAVHAQATQLVKANNDAKIQITKRNADIDSGAYRLRVVINSPTFMCNISSTEYSNSSDAALLTAK